MGSVAYLAWRQAARRWRGLAVAAIVVGLIAGISASLIAGSRRSASVVDRYFRAHTHYDVYIYVPWMTRAQLLAFPGVARADPFAYVGMNRHAPDGNEKQGINGLAFDPAALDPTVQVLRGRVADPADMFAVLVNESFVSTFGSRVGDRVDVRMYRDQDLDNANRGIFIPTGPRYQFHVTGVIRGPSDVVLDETHDARRAGVSAPNNSMLVPFRFYETYRHTFKDFGAAYDIQLVPGATAEALVVALNKRAGPQDFPVGVGPPPDSQRRASIDTPVNVEASLLLGLGIAVALLGVVVAALTLLAEQRAHGADEPTLRGLGLTRSDLGLVAAARTAPFAAFAGVLCAGVAVAVSGRFPIGIGRRIELHPGLAANVAVLAIAASATVVAMSGLAYLVGRWGVHRQVRSRARATTLARSLSRTGAPVDVVLGTHLAFERGATAASMSSRQTVFGGALSIAAIAALGVFIAGVGDLYTRPAAHGWTWDLVIGNSNFQLTNPTLAELAADRRIAAQTVAGYGHATLGTRSVDVLAIDPAGSAPPTTVSGRLPRSSDEIALGAAVAPHLHLQVGDNVQLSVKGGDFDRGGSGDGAARPALHALPLHVVGIAVPPVFGQSDLGESAVVTRDAVTSAGGVVAPNFVFARVNGNRARTVAAISRDYTEEMVTDVVPARIVNLHQVRQLPLVALLFAAGLGTVLLAYTLWVGARVRTRQLAVLRALGMPVRRLSRVLAYQGVVLAVAMCLIGLPIGLLVGSNLWRIVARQIGVGEHPVISPLTALLIPAAIIIGVAVSYLPGRRACRHAVASLLGDERG